jgi:hypothetical protein
LPKLMSHCMVADLEDPLPPDNAEPSNLRSSPPDRSNRSENSATALDRLDVPLVS